MLHSLFHQQLCGVDPYKCFVMLPFDPTRENIYDTVESIVKDYCGFQCIRADEIYGSSGIMEDIWININEARFLIADLTDRNPNVLYEVGMAHSLHRPVILITQDMSDVPF